MPELVRESRQARIATMLAGGVLWSSVVVLALLGPSRGLLTPSLIAYSASFVSLISLYRWGSRILDDFRVLLLGALLLRLTLFAALPDLSDDLFRYVWDGWLSVSGVNPYRWVPSDPRLGAFQGSDLFAALNSPGYHSIYPPLSQIVFMVGGAAYEAWGWPAAAFAIKGVFLLLETTGVLLLTLAALRMGVRARSMILYAWNPLVLVTLTAGGHSESGLILGLGLLAYAVAGNRPRLSWIGLVLAAGAKGIPILLGPLLLRHQWTHLGPRRALLTAEPAGALGLALVAPFYFPGLPSAVGSSVDLYVRLFEFNAGPYLALKEAGLWLTGMDLGKVIGPVLRWIFLAATVWIWFRGSVGTAPGFARTSLAILGLYLVTATTVHPWYLTWGLALTPLTPFTRTAWVWASWAAFPTYFVYVGAPDGLLASLFWVGVGVALLKEWEGELRDRLLRVAGRRKARQVSGLLVGDLVLDLGAGEGYVATNLQTGGRRLLLAEVGPYFRRDMPGVVYDGRNLPFADRSVDSVLLSLVLHHAHDPDRVVAEALRVARERVVITESTYVWGWERRLLEIADRWANRTRGMSAEDAAGTILRLRTVAEWEGAFERSGGRVLRSGRLNRVGHRHHLFVLERAVAH